MGGMEVEYDEEGSTFYFFLLSFWVLVMFPSTYYLWPSVKNSTDDRGSKRRQCMCSDCLIKRKKLEVKTSWKNTRKRAIQIGLLIGWLIFAFLVYKVSMIKMDYTEYDPFQILQIERDATDRDIKRAYRKLSLKFHPDKAEGDSKMFMRVAKAYAALTDEESKKNWKEFGNPDGPGVTRFGIALPSWIIDDKNSTWVADKIFNTIMGKRKSTSAQEEDGLGSSTKIAKSSKSANKSASSAEKSSSKTPSKSPKSASKKPTAKGGKSEDGVTGGKKSYPKLVDETDNFETEKLEFTEPTPTKNAAGQLVFTDYPEFRPNMTPKEVLQAGSFGGTYFRPIKSSITGKSYSGVWKELPEDWLKGLNIAKQVASSTYHENVNTYGVKCGGSLEMWEESGWIHKQDPYGWFMWYCRFYQGRRTSDDERQIGRWLRCAGVTGRWRNNLISKCVRTGCGYDNHGVSPVVRQTLQHWGYKLNQKDFDAYAKKMAKKGM